jgi:hypothetical protein
VKISNPAHARFGMPKFAGLVMSTAGAVTSAYAVAEARTRLIDSRNGAQGGSDAWSPPV